MLRKFLCTLAVILATLQSSATPLRGQQHSMPGMSDSVHKQSTTKKKPTAKKKKAATKRAKGGMPAKQPKRPMSEMTHAADSLPPMQRRDSMQMPDSMSSMSHSRDSLHRMQMKDSTPMADSMAMSRPMPMGDSMAGMRPMTADDMMFGPLGISMERMGSGTTWIPDAVTMPSRRTMFGSWMVMAHGFAFAQYDHQSGTRGDDQFGSLNWAMLMATRNVAGGRFQARTMLSLDAAGVTARGYPLLLQTGEAFHGLPLHDRQHPHDFWMELGALYQRQFTPGIGWSLYAAPSGEPALGTVAFMHRPSAMDNPSAPLSHHWQDATHVSFGVVSGGLFTRTFQMEASAFNGREPDDKRWNFDPIRLDSYSSRVTFSPSAEWSFSGGFGYMKSPEGLHPSESMHRLTASVLHGKRIGADGQIATALIWGANKQPGRHLSQSLLAESEAIVDRWNTVFGRAEWIQKSAEDLVVDVGSGSAAPTFSPAFAFNVGSLQLGYIREIVRGHGATLGLGGAGTLSFVPALLESHYGSRTPVGLFVFLRLRPFHDRVHGHGVTIEHQSHE